MDDAVERYCAASTANDMAALAATLADGVELTSPVSGRMVFRGKADVVHVLTQVHRLLHGLRWVPLPGTGPQRAAYAEARIAGLRLTDAMLLDLDAEGRITRVRPHLRPWSALTVFAALLGPRVLARPRAVTRALRG